VKQHPHAVMLRASSESDVNFVNMLLTRRVMRQYVEITWKSTKGRERYYERNRFQQSKTKIIQCNGIDIGRITTTILSARMVIDGIHIVEDFQGRGIGRQLISQVINNAHKKGMPVELILLKANPVKKLYDRLGFHTYKEDMNRYYMGTAI